MSEEPVGVQRPRLAQKREYLRLTEASARAATNVGQLPTSVDLTLYQGDDFFLNVTVVGATVDLTGCIAKADLSATVGGTKVASFVATVTGTTTIGLHLTSVESAKLPTSAVWDLQVTDTTGLVTTLAAGAVTVVRQVTQ